MVDESDVSTAPQPAAGRGFQFSLLALFLLMTGMAVALGGIVALAAALGLDLMPAILPTIGWMFNLFPMYVVWLVAIVMLVNRSSRHPRASRLGIGGFGGLLLLSLMGIGFQLLVNAILSSGRPIASFNWLFSIYRVFHSVLTAMCHGCLLAAILASRSEPSSAAQRHGWTEDADDMKRDAYDRDG